MEAQQKQKWLPDLNKQYKQIVIPNLIQGFFMGLFGLMNTFILSGVSQNNLVAMGIVMQLQMVFFLFNYGTINGISVFIAQYIGKEDYKGLNKLIAMSKVAFIALVVIYLTITTLFADNVLAIFTHNQEIIKIAKHILKWFWMGILFRLYTMHFNSSLRAFNENKKLLYLNLVVLVVNFLLSYTLTYGILGLPKLGINGTIIGVNVSQTINLILTLILVTKKGIWLGFSGVKYLNKEFVMVVVKKTLPLLFMEVTWSIGIVYYIVIISWRGTDYLAAAELTGTIISFFMTIYSSMNAATSTIIGRTLGRNEFDKAKYSAKILIKYSLIFGICANIVLILGAKYFIEIFNFSGKLHAQTISYAIIILIARSGRIGVGSIAVTFINGILKSGGDTNIIPFIELSSILIFGLGFSLISYSLNLSIFWVALGMSIEQVCRLIFGWIRYKQFKWVNNVTI